MTGPKTLSIDLAKSRFSKNFWTKKLATQIRDLGRQILR